MGEILPLLHVPSSLSPGQRPPGSSSHYSMFLFFFFLKSPCHPLKTTHTSRPSLFLSPYFRLAIVLKNCCCVTNPLQTPVATTTRVFHSQVGRLAGSSAPRVSHPHRGALREAGAGQTREGNATAAAHPKPLLASRLLKARWQSTSHGQTSHPRAGAGNPPL